MATKIADDRPVRNPDCLREEEFTTEKGEKKLFVTYIGSRHANTTFGVVGANNDVVSIDVKDESMPMGDQAAFAVRDQIKAKEAANIAQFVQFDPNMLSRHASSNLNPMAAVAEARTARLTAIASVLAQAVEMHFEIPLARPVYPHNILTGMGEASHSDCDSLG